MSKTPARIAVTEETSRKARLLAALLNMEINEAVDLAITKLLEEVQAQQAQPKTAPKKKVK